jgi:hypothetical protein
MSNGAQIEFDSPPEENYYNPPPNKIKVEHLDSIRRQLYQYVNTGVLLRYPARYIMSLMSVERSDDPLRPRFVTNGHNLSGHIRKYKMMNLPTLNQLKQIVSNYNFAAKLDLQDAFHNIPIDPTQWKYLGINFEGETYCFRYCPFAIATSAHACQRVTHHVAQLADPCIVVYYDDFLIPGLTPNDVHDKLQRLQALLTQWKLPINIKKSISTPITELDYLRYNLNFSTGVITNKRSKVNKLQATVFALTTSVPNQQLQSVLGKIESLLPPKMYTYQLQHLKSFINYNTKCNNQLITLSTDAIQIMHDLAKVTESVTY